MTSRKKVVDLAVSWIGKSESNGGYLDIINIYNSQKTFPRGIKMNKAWSWCACTWSALAIKLGYTDVMPIEISCGELINKAKKMEIWIENDSHLPKPGDAILYDWDDDGKGDDTGWPDHIGVIETVNKNSGYFTVIEGNYSNAVKRRTVSINGRYIRGFICPNYDQDGTQTNTKTINTGRLKSISEISHEVIAGDWGSGNDRKNALTAAGYKYSEIQAEVNKILNGQADESPEVKSNDQNQPYKATIRCTEKNSSTDKSKYCH